MDQVKQAESKHTPEPWGWQFFGPHLALVGMHSDRPIVLDVTPHGVVRFNVGGIMRPITMVAECDQHPDFRLIKAAPDLLAACKELVQFFDQCRPGGKVLKSDPDIDAARAAIAKAGSSGSEQAVQNNQAETGAGKPAFRATKVQPDEPGEVYRVVGPYGTVAVYAGEGSQEQADDAALLLSNVWLHMQMPTLLRLASLVLEDSSKLPAFVDAHGAAIKQAVVNGGVA